MPEVRALPRFLGFFAWASFVTNVLIIGTGGAVRLTGSGLGCTQWPLCTPESLIPTPELSYHSLIEFGNRTISGPLLVFAVVTWLITLLAMRARKDLLVLASVALAGVLLQAFIGGVVVWMHLNANLVGVHYFLSVALVCVTAAYLARLHRPSPSADEKRPAGFAMLSGVTAVVMTITIIVGILTTGAGPHSGDANVERHGFDATILSHVHAWPGYALAALTIVLLVWSMLRRLRCVPWVITVFALQLVQIGLGIYQARSGLPPLIVGMHMVLASLTAAAMTVLMLRLPSRASRADERRAARAIPNQGVNTP